VEAVREGRGQLALVGVGDPTGRGYGFSFTKEVRKQADPEKTGVPRRDAGTITGATAVYRSIAHRRRRP
jgi:hypothetical protein